MKELLLCPELGGRGLGLSSAGTWFSSFPLPPFLPISSLFLPLSLHPFSFFLSFFLSSFETGSHLSQSGLDTVAEVELELLVVLPPPPKC